MSECVDCEKEIKWWEVHRFKIITGWLWWRTVKWIEPLCYKCWWEREGY